MMPKIYLHYSCAWFDRLTMREVYALQGVRNPNLGGYRCSPQIPLMVSLSNHAHW